MFVPLASATTLSRHHALPNWQDDEEEGDSDASDGGGWKPSRYADQELYPMTHTLTHTLRLTPYDSHPMTHTLRPTPYDPHPTTRTLRLTPYDSHPITHTRL